MAGLRRSSGVMGLSLIAAEACLAGVIRVPEDYPSVLAALDASAAGDSVLVAAGTWTDTATRVVLIGGSGKTFTMLKVAEAIEMHESTVSRVTSNKYLATDRGMFELKYFFGSGVASEGGEGAAAEAVKAAIKALIDSESDILSDDAIAGLLKDNGMDVARRTVVKYREAMGIGSSIQRRRLRKIAG